MRRTLSTVAAIAVTATLVGTTPGYGDDGHHSEYSIVDLGTLPQNGPGGYCTPLGLNNRGEIVGAIGHAEAATAYGFLWRNGAMVDISLAGFGMSVGDGINDGGQVVGHSLNLGPSTNSFQSWFWHNGRFTLLSTTLWPSSVNASAQVAGFVESTTTEPRRAALWEQGAVTLLPSDGHQSDATALNNRGSVVGEIYVRVPSPGFPGFTIVVHAILWRDGGIIDLGQLGPLFGNEGAFATAINNHDWVVGQSNAPGMHDHAFLWRKGLMTDLGTAPGFTESRANGINDAGDVVGDSTMYSASFGRNISRATLWQDGRVVDLNDLKPAGFPGTLVAATAINRRGQIVGVLSMEPNPPNSYKNRCFLMTPTPTTDASD